LLEIPQGVSRRAAQRLVQLTRTCFRSAFRHGVIDNGPFWIDLTVLRNYTVHTYNEQLADNVMVDRVRVAGKFELLPIGGGPKLTSRSRSAAQSTD
jgi:hypothetical protein